jgi:hypothetical protein
LIGANIEQWYLDLKNSFEEYLGLILPGQPFEDCDLSCLNMAYAYFGSLHLPSNNKLLEKTNLEETILSTSEPRSRSISISSHNSSYTSSPISSELNDSISSGSRISKKTSRVINGAAFFQDPARPATSFFGGSRQEDVSHEFETKINRTSNS